MNNQKHKEFDEKVVQIKRVSKKTKGGSRISFTALVVVGDKKGRVGVGLGKAPTVRATIMKAANYAKKHLISVSIKGTTITHQITHKMGAARVLLKPAPPGTGLIAGAPVRAVVEAAGIQDISSKILGSRSKANNVYATLEALKKLKMIDKKPKHISRNKQTNKLKNRKE